MKVIHPQSALVKDLSQCDFSKYTNCSLFDTKLETTKKQCSPSTLLLGDHLEPAEVVSWIVDSGAHHLTQKCDSHFQSDVEFSLSNIQNPNHYFNQTAQTLAKGVVSQKQLDFTGPQDKDRLRSELTNFLSATKTQNVVESAEAIFEELYMNAVIDAPREAAKKNQSNNSYAQGLKATFHLALSDSHLVLCSEDPFGSLDPHKFINRMNEVYKKGAGESINFREGGAGLGCVIMFEHCKSMHLGVIRGKRTVVSCVVPLGMSYRQRSQVKKSLHLISI